MTTKINYNQIKSAPVNVLDYGAVADGSGITGTNNAVAIQAALTAGAGGVVVIPPGSYLIDTLIMPSNTTLSMYGATLLMKAHTTTKNPMFWFGVLAAGITNSNIFGGKLVGNSASQTFASEEYSAGIWVWGSTYCKFQDIEITDCKGDGIELGYESGRYEGSDHNIVSKCRIYSNSRQQISIPFGSENSIVDNRVGGNIDIEIDTGGGAISIEAKNNIVRGNTGIDSSAFTVASSGIPRTSSLAILVATLNSNPGQTQGNIIDGNECRLITAQNCDSTIISNNTIIGSTTGATYLQLIDLTAANNTKVIGNTLIQNKSLPTTSLTSLLRTRGCNNLTVIGNTCPQLSGIPFHSYVSSYIVLGGTGGTASPTNSGGGLLFQIRDVSNNIMNGLSTGTPVLFTTTSTLPTNIAAGVIYYAIFAPTAPGTFYVATTLANAYADTKIAYVDAGVGVQTANNVAEPNSHYFSGNIIPYSADYRTTALNPSEWAKYRIDAVTGTITATQVAGVPHSIAVSGSGNNLYISTGIQTPLIAISPMCNATAAASASMTHQCMYTSTYSSPNTIITMLTYAPAAGAITQAAFSFSATNTGTFFVDVWY